MEWIPEETEGMMFAIQDQIITTRYYIALIYTVLDMTQLAVLATNHNEREILIKTNK